VDRATRKDEVEEAARQEYDAASADAPDDDAGLRKAARAPVVAAERHRKADMMTDDRRREDRSCLVVPVVVVVVVVVVDDRRRSWWHFDILSNRARRSLLRWMSKGLMCRGGADLTMVMGLGPSSRSIDRNVTDPLASKI
jgi:hypothetical protein